MTMISSARTGRIKNPNPDSLMQITTEDKQITTPTTLNKILAAGRAIPLIISKISSQIIPSKSKPAGRITPLTRKTVSHQEISNRHNKIRTVINSRTEILDSKIPVIMDNNRHHHARIMVSINGHLRITIKFPKLPLVQKRKQAMG